jgi:hypothetical protein
MDSGYQSIGQGFSACAPNHRRQGISALGEVAKTRLTAMIKS